MSIIHSQSVLVEVLLFFCLSGMLVPIMEKFNINKTIGFLLAGFIFGPSLIGKAAEAIPFLSYFTVSNSEIIEELAELGIMFMLFTIGLELSLKKLWSLRYWVFVTGSLQIILTSVIFYLILNYFDIPIASALLLSIAFSFSSTAIVSQYLLSENELGNQKGRVVISVLLFQDLAVIPTLILTNSIGTSAEIGFSLFIQLISVLGYSAVVITILYFLGRLVINPMIKIGTSHKDSLDSFFAIILLLFFGVLAICHAFDISLALGALLIGLLLADTEYKHAAGVMIDPFRGLLLGIFFLTVGFKINIDLIMNDYIFILAAVALIFILKTAVLFVLLVFSKIDKNQSLTYSGLLAQSGEFAFVVIASASTQNIIAPAYTELAIIITTISMFLALPYYHFIEFFADKYIKPDSGPVDKMMDANYIPEMQGHIVIAGYGRVGSMVGTILYENNIPFIALEHNANKIKKIKNKPNFVFFGSPLSPGIIERLNLDRASAVILTMDNSETISSSLKSIRKDYPSVTIISRSKDDKHTKELFEAGSDIVIPETIEVGLQFVAYILEIIGQRPSAVNSSIEIYREKYQYFNK